MNYIHKLFPPRVITQKMTDEAIKEFKDNLTYEQKNHHELLKRVRNEVKKQQSQSKVFLMIAGVLFLTCVIAALYNVPVPSESKGIWIWRGVAALGFLLLIAQNMLDGPFMKTFRFAKLRGKTIVLIKRGDGKWGWISDDLRARAVTSDIYGEYAVTPGSLAMVDGVPVGFADESQGLTLPTYLLKIAQQLGIHGILDYGTLDSVGNIEQKIEEYKGKLIEIEKYIEKNKTQNEAEETRESPKDEFDEEIEEVQRQIQLQKQEEMNIMEEKKHGYLSVIEYLSTIKENFKEIIDIEKYTLKLKPLLDFIPTMANNPTFKRTSRERAIAMEKAKSNQGTDPMKWVVMFCMAIGTIGLVVYLIQSGQAKGLVTAASSAGASAASAPQGIS